MSPESRHWLGDGCRAGSCICVVSLPLLVLHAMRKLSAESLRYSCIVQDLQNDTIDIWEAAYLRSALADNKDTPPPLHYAACITQLFDG